MFRFKPIHIHGEEPSFDHFRLRTLTELVKTRLPTVGSASPYILASFVDFYASPSHLFAVFDQGKSFVSLDAVAQSQQRQSDAQGGEIVRELSKPSSPPNSSFGGATIANTLLFRHEHRIISIQVIFLGQTHCLVALDVLGTSFFWTWDANESKWQFVASLNFTTSAAPISPGAAPAQADPGFIQAREQNYVVRSRDLDIVPLALAALASGVPTGGTAGKTGSLPGSTSAPSSVSASGSPQAKKWSIQFTYANSLVLGEVERPKEGPLAAVFFGADLGSSKDLGGVWLVFTDKVAFVSVIKSPHVQQSSHDLTPILAATMHPLTNELVVLLKGGSMWVYSAQYTGEALGLRLGAGQVNPALPLQFHSDIKSPDQIIGFEALSHSLVVITTDRAYIFDMRSGTKLEDTYLPQGGKIDKATRGGGVWKRAQAKDSGSLGIWLDVGVWYLKPPSVPELLKSTAELSATVTTASSAQPSPFHSVLQNSEDWKLPHYKAKYLLDLIEKLLQSPNQSEGKEMLEAQFRATLADLVDNHLQNPAILLALFHQPQSFELSTSFSALGIACKSRANIAPSETFFASKYTNLCDKSIE